MCCCFNQGPTLRISRRRREEYHPERRREAHRSRQSRAEQTTLNEQFRRWLEDYVRRDQQAAEARAVMRKLSGKLRVGRKLGRDEMDRR